MSNYKISLKMDKMYIFHFQWLTLTSEMHYAKFHPEVASCLLTLQRQKKVCTPGDEAIMKIHKIFFFWYSI